MRSFGFEKRASGRSLLVVEDDADIRETLDGLLSMEGFHVIGCSNGREALDWLHASPKPDVILLDLMMPVMDGWQFRVVQKQDPELSAIPVVALSADATAKAAAIDADAYLKKPVEYETLLETIDHLLVASEHRELQARLAQTDRLTSLGTLTAGVAHEINNPLTYVLGNASVVARELEQLNRAVRERRDSAGALLDLVAERTHSLSEALVEIQDGAERIRGIVVDLRAFSRPESAERPGDVRSALDWALRVIEPELRARAQLVTHLEPLPNVRPTGGNLGQVFLNLLLNAVQAVAESSAREHVIEVSAGVEPSGFVLVDVKDTGVGMAPDVLKRIFEPFFTTKPVGKGTGLGLSICHGIVTAAGGEIEVLSTPGLGSRFRVRLPIDLRSEPPRESSQQPGSEHRAKILVIDDEQQVGTAIRRILSGHEVVSTTKAAEALGLIAQGGNFELVLCDLAMAEISGRELYERLTAEHPEYEDRVVFMSGGAFSPETERFLKSTTRLCLSKPFGAAELRDRVNKLLRARAKH